MQPLPPMSKLRPRKHLITQLVRAARGADSHASAAPPTNLPCFPLQQHHFGQLAGSASPRTSDGSGVQTGGPAPSVATPSDFHSYLCDKIKHAQERIVIASLYVGVGSNTNQASKGNDSTSGGDCKEDKLLESLQFAASNKNLKKVKVLLDANRALRKVSVTEKNKQSHGSSDSNDARRTQTNSAEAVLSRLNHFGERSPNDRSSGLFLFPVNDKRLCTILPSPLNEVAGVFHIKAYIVDDELILSGANLSEEYFSNRLDRYMLFTNGGGGLVDFYANLCDILCEYATRYDERSHANAIDLSSFFSSQDEQDRKEKLESSLMRLFDGGNQSHDSEGDDETDPVAYAVPTFQMPTAFLGRPPRLRSDAGATRDLLLSALENEGSASARLSSAYLNPTPGLASALALYGREGARAPHVLTAGAISHGFAPRAGPPRKAAGILDRAKSTIPGVFLALATETARSITKNGGKILLYERPGWTFHAKGIWITANDGDGPRPEIINDPSSLLATIIGSGNYGARSEDLDVESNCILVFNESGDDKKKEVDPCSIKHRAAAEWNNMCEFSNALTEEVKVADYTNHVMRVVLAFMKPYL